MKIQPKKLIVCKFGVTLYPSKVYDAVPDQYGRGYMAKHNSGASVLIFSRHAKLIS